MCNTIFNQLLIKYCTLFNSDITDAWQSFEKKFFVDSLPAKINVHSQEIIILIIGKTGNYF